MKLKQDKTTTTLSIGDIEAKAFGIDTSNGVIFDILRNKMYSNKIAAVAREISSNSRDANRENSKADTPVEIVMVAPNVLMNSTDTQIMFKDAGIGITPDRMDNVFLKYGASSKRNTNKQTGGFGLGAKTPFAYTDTFTVITVCDHEGKRMKYIYTGSITDKAGVGSGEMILFSEEETKEPTGTAIVVPIKDSDRYEFEEEIYRATAFWKTKPKYKGLTREEWKNKVEHKGKGFFVVEDPASNFDGQKIMLVIDGIPYNLDRGQVGLNSNGMSNFFYNTDKVLCFEFNNGDLTVSANREAVQYDRATKTKILWRIRQAKNAFRVELEKKMAACDTYLSACIFANGLRGHGENLKMKLWEHVASYFLQGLEFKYGTKVLAQQAHFDYYDVYRYEKYDANGKLFGLEMNKRTYDEKWTLPLYLMSSGKRHTGKNATLVDAGGFILVVPTKIDLKIDGKDAAQQKFYQETYDKAVARQVEETKILLEFGVTINDYANVVPKVMPKGVSDSSSYRKTNEVGVQVRRIGDSTNYRNWSSHTVTFLRKEKATMNGKTYIFCTTDKLTNFGSYAQDSPELPSSVQLEKGIVAASLLGYDFVCVPERDTHYFADAQMLTTAEAWKLVESDPLHVAKIVDAKNYLACRQLSLQEGWRKLKLTGRVDAAIEAVIKQTFDNAAAKNPLISLSLHQITDIKPTVSTDGVKAALQKLYKKYPMLQLFIEEYRSYSYSNNDARNARHMNKVMDIVDEHKVLSEEEEEAIAAAAKELAEKTAALAAKELELEKIRAAKAAVAAEEGTEEAAA